MIKEEVVKLGWVSDAQSSKNLKGQWKKASALGTIIKACRLRLWPQSKFSNPLFPNFPGGKDKRENGGGGDGTHLS